MGFFVISVDFGTKPPAMANDGSVSMGERRPELDGVRGVAILLVLVGHGLQPYGFEAFAAVGVALFFTLSGYLITDLLWEEHRNTDRVNIRRFYARRMTRLAPPLFFMLAVTGVLLRPGWAALLPPATWTTNYVSILKDGVEDYRHTWSLAVEEQFYLVWPLALSGLLFLRNPARILLRIIALLMIWQCLLLIGGHLRYAYGALETAGTAILAGCYVALARWRLPAIWAPLSLTAMMLVSLWSSLGSLSRFAVPMYVTAATAALVAAASSAPWLAWRPLIACGVASYSMYLWHEPVARSFVRLTQSVELAPLAVAVGACFGAAAYLALELPVMRWRRRTYSSDRRDARNFANR